MKITRLLLIFAAACVGFAQVKTGPAVGERIPDFEAVDQNGKRQSFDTLKGENGLLLMFVRSADW